MQIIIDVPDDKIKLIKDCIMFDNMVDIDIYDTVLDAIRNGKPLPEHRGRLIDEDALISEIKDLKKSPWYKDNTNFAYLPRKEAVEVIEIIIGETPTIIEADKENKTC